MTAPTDPLVDQILAAWRDTARFCSPAFAFDEALRLRAEQLVTAHYGHPLSDAVDAPDRTDDPQWPTWRLIYASTPEARYVVRVGRTLAEEIDLTNRPNPHGLPAQWQMVITLAISNARKPRAYAHCDWHEGPDDKPEARDRDILLHSRGTHILVWSVCGKCRRRLDRYYPGGLLLINEELARLDRVNTNPDGSCRGCGKQH